jgi:hypothetical protein
MESRPNDSGTAQNPGLDDTPAKAMAHSHPSAMLSPSVSVDSGFRRNDDSGAMIPAAEA